MIIQSGNMPDDETLNAAGISRTQAQALLGTTGQTIPATTTTTRRTSGGTETRTPVQEETTQQTTGNAAGMNVSHFNAFANSLAMQLQSGKVDAAQGNLSSRWAELSAEQQQRILDLLAKFGY